MKMGFLRDIRGSGAAEFALVLPLLLILLFGVIDGGRWLWTFNEAVKATQVGSRVAAVTKVIPPGLATSYVGVTPAGATGPLTQGDLIPANALGTVTCTKAASTVTCTCTTTPCPSLGTASAIGWDAIVARMKRMLPSITDANVVVQYGGSGIGYAGDPDGQDISPLITVKLQGLTFTPITFLTLKRVQAIPTAATTLTAEDELGSQSN